MKIAYAMHILACFALISCGQRTVFVGGAPQSVTKRQSDDSTDAGPRSTQFFNFTAAQSPTVQMEFTPGKGESALEIDLANEPVRSTLEFTQDILTRKSKTLQQNAGWKFAQDISHAPTSGTLDIAIVIDNSPSMKEEQDKLATKLSVLLSELNDVDWRMAIVTTDYREKPGDAANPRPRSNWCEYLTPQTKNVGEKFKQAIQAGITGWKVENAFLRIEHLMKYQCVGAPQNWHRTDTPLAVLIVSDEDNCSDGTECSGTNPDTENPYRSPSDFLKLLQSYGKIPGKSAKVYGLIGDPSDPNSNCGSAIGVPAKQYSQVIHETGGISGPICAPAYDTVLKTMSRNFRSLSYVNIYLEHLPLLTEPIEVYIEGSMLDPSLYTVRDNVVSIKGDGVVKNDLMVVEYRWGESLTREFEAFEKEPFPETILVKVNQTVLPPQAWKFKPPRTLSFVVPPPPNATLEVIGVSVESGKGKFKFETNVAKLVEPEVWVNDTIASTDSYKIDEKGNVSFNTPPAEGSRIKITHTSGSKRSNKIKIKELARASSVVVRNAETNAVISSNFENETLTIEDAIAQKTKRVRITYSEPGNARKRSFQLPSKPATQNIKVWVDNEICPAEVDSSAVATLQCAVSDTSQVKLKYTEAGDKSLRTFRFAKPIALPESWEWIVLVDGQRSLLESYDANGFVLQTQPDSGARIELTLSPR